MRRSSTFWLAALGFALSAGISSAGPDAPAGAIVKPAPEPASTQAVPTTPALAKPEPVICKREESTGSRLPGPKECHTRAEWARINADGYDNLRIQAVPHSINTP